MYMCIYLMTHVINKLQTLIFLIFLSKNKHVFSLENFQKMQRFQDNYFLYVNIVRFLVLYVNMV